MYDYKILFGILSIILGIITYPIYIRDIFYGRTKPHLFSWLIWTLLTAIAYFAQIEKGAESGSWVTATTAVMCLIITLIAIKKGEKEILSSDWICLCGGIISILLWQLTNNPLYAVVIVTITDVFGFIPTYVKGYKKPLEDTPITFLINGLGFGVSLLALEVFSITTALYSIYLFSANTIFALMIYYRRRTKSSPTSSGEI